MKKQLLSKILLFSGLILSLTGCTSLDYVSEDVSEVKVANITTREDFILKAVKKTDGYADISIGISQTSLPETLVLYIGVKNNSPETRYRVDIKNISVTSPIGQMSFMQPSNFISNYKSI